jgi:hypothetical protein
VSRENLKERIRHILSESEAKLKASQIHETIENKYSDAPSERTTQLALQELYQEKESVSRIRMPDGSPGAPPYFYFLGQDSGEDSTEPDAVKGMPHSEDVQTRSEAEGEIEGGDQRPQNLMEDIAQRHLESSSYVEEIREVAPEIAEKDPKELIIELLEWSCDEINERSDEVYKADKNGHLRRFSKEKNMLEDFVGWVEYYFHDLLRLDYIYKNGEHKKILNVPSVSDFYGEDVEYDDLPRASFDEELAQERLRERIHGENFIYEQEIGAEGLSAAGTDASVAEISLNSNNPHTRSTSISLFTGAAALEKDNSKYTDFDFDPEDFKRYRDREAFKEGLLMSGRVYPELSQSQREKAKYAAMDLRQYNENIRVARNRATWRPVGERKDDPEDFGGPDIIFGDGRVFPLVHQISDVNRTNVYGDLVRREVDRFAEMMEMAGRDFRLVDSTFAGVVKKPEVSLLTPLVFYYVEKENGNTEDEENIPTDIYKPRLPDSVVSNLLFIGLARERELSEDSMFVTFRWLRRFYEISLEDRQIPLKDNEGNALDPDDDEDWKRFFEDLIENREERGSEVLSWEDYRPFAVMCEKSSQLMTYSAPQSLYNFDGDPERTQVLLPRLEVAVSPPRDAREDLHEVLSWYADNIRRDRDHADDGFSSLKEIDVAVPSVIVESDQAAKFARDKMSNKVEQDIRRTIQKLRQSTQK